jgi:homoserine dehydrogenase
MAIKHKHLNIALFGFGTVGQALYALLSRVNSPNVTISRICVRDINKPRRVDANFTDDADAIFNDPDINFIVELIDDEEASFQIVKRALLSGRTVVSGNRKMLARHILELIDLQKQTGTALLYDASACGSIPVIRNLEEYYDNDLLISVKGILNGASNYVLSKIFNENIPYATALQQAKDLNYVDRDPSIDLDGYDSLYKLIIVTIHAFGTYVAPEKIFCYGISTMNECDIRFANEKDRRVKLVAHVEKIEGNKLVMSVMPQLLSRNKYIYSVEDEYNGVVIKGLFYDKQFMFGRGAGGYPTASAVLSDITACLYNYRYEYKKRNDSEMPEFTNNTIFRIYYRYNTPEDRAIIHFEDVFESYTSLDYNYIVGNVSLHTLLKVRERLLSRNVFIAAYPRD